MRQSCPFCARIGSASEGAVAFDDAFPVADGHRLVVPVRHIALIEDLPAAEWDVVFALVRDEVRRVRERPDVVGVNVGVNSGPGAGQTVDHAHVHVIPRVAGDVPDPRGGVRWVLPQAADYWSAGG